MSKKKKHKKSAIGFTTWLVGAITDLVIGLLIAYIVNRFF
jgi:uncharacterized membrane-anchored protein YhcB (DUF1043 family)